MAGALPRHRVRRGRRGRPASDSPTLRRRPHGEPTPDSPTVARRLGGSRSMKKVVLAYSGGLDTSVAVAWLKEQYGVEVVTLTVDVGGGSLRQGVERRAMAAGGPQAGAGGAPGGLAT